ncbi:MAG: hypothetical protein VCD31_06640, partial [Alphaproteobacteria bacterium]
MQKSPMISLRDTGVRAAFSEHQPSPPDHQWPPEIMPPRVFDLFDRSKRHRYRACGFAVRRKLKCSTLRLVRPFSPTSLPPGEEGLSTPWAAVNSLLRGSLGQYITGVKATQLSFNMSDVAAPAPVRRRRRVLRVFVHGLIIVALLIAVALFGWQWWSVERFRESTDNAYIRSEITPISSKIDRKSV